HGQGGRRRGGGGVGMSGDLVLRVLARALPPLARERYLEEWRADAAGAHEAGLGRRGVLLGAGMVVLTIDRGLPAHTGEPREARPRRLARRGGSLLVAAALVLTGTWLTGGGIVPEGAAATPAALSALQAVVRVLVGASALAVLLGALYLVRAATAARTALAKVALVVVAVGGGMLALGALAPGVPGVVTLGGLTLTVVGVVAGRVVGGGSAPIALVPRSAPRRQRVPVALAGLAIVLTLVAVGAADLLVWNPQAKVPGTDLAAVYGEMVARDGFDVGAGVTMVAVWAAFWVAAALVVVGLALRRGRSGLTRRRIAILMLALVAGAVVGRFFAGFSIGMSIADTFATSGGDASLVSAALPLVGQLCCAAAAIAFGWAPRIARPPSAPALEPAGP
ncbi:MAG: hypothetical protein Q7T71_17475, partial [Herbiconiux sp.]|nr:hypothetical protein [Herbiconiux sp.]